MYLCDWACVWLFMWWLYKDCNYVMSMWHDTYVMLMWLRIYVTEHYVKSMWHGTYVMLMWLRIYMITVWLSNYVLSIWLSNYVILVWLCNYVMSLWLRTYAITKIIFWNTKAVICETFVKGASNVNVLMSHFNKSFTPRRIYQKLNYHFF